MNEDQQVTRRRDQLAQSQATLRLLKRRTLRARTLVGLLFALELVGGLFVLIASDHARFWIGS